MKKYWLAIVNLLVSIIFGVLLFIGSLSEHMIYLITITLFIGWIMPYIVLFITGIQLIYMKHVKMTFVFNGLCILMCIMDFYFSLKLFDKKMILNLIQYGIMGIICFINFIYLLIYMKKHPDKENERIKKIKEENNGVIV